MSSLKSHGRFRHRPAGFGSSRWERFSMWPATAPSTSCPI